MDAKGRPGGLIVGWRNKSMLYKNTWVMENGLGLSFYSMELKSICVLVNIYGSYIKSEVFWHNLLSKKCIGKKNLILGGDLKFSMGLSESRGPCARDDSLTH